MNTPSASDQIDAIIAAQDDWKALLLREIRAAITHVSHEIVEDVKWKMPTRPAGLPVWLCNGIVCFAEIWKDNIKLLFPHGAQLEDSDSVFNSRLQSKDIRAIEYKSGMTVDAQKLGTLVAAAIAYNTAKN